MKTTIEERIEKLEYIQTVIIIIVLVMMAAIIALSLYVFFGSRNKESSTGISNMAHEIMITETVPILADYNLDESLPPVSSKCISEKHGYNIETDAWINSILDKEPIEYEKRNDSSYFMFRWNEIRITVYYDVYIPYVHPEEWSIFCRTEDGKVIMLQSPLGLPQHRVSDNTIQRIINMCKP